MDRNADQIYNQISYNQHTHTHTYMQLTFPLDYYIFMFFFAGKNGIIVSNSDSKMDKIYF